MVGFLLWCILFILCWPLALFALILYPIVWLLLLPFRLVGIAVGGVLELVWALITLPARVICRAAQPYGKSPLCPSPQRYNGPNSPFSGVDYLQIAPPPPEEEILFCQTARQFEKDRAIPLVVDCFR